MFPPSSLIICSRNRPHLLDETVSSLLKADEVPSELIIIDQSSAQHPILTELRNDRECRLRYIWEPGVGSSRARNQGIGIASHEIIAFIDDDMRVATDWYGALIRALAQAGPRSAVTGRVLAAPKEAGDSFVVAVHDWPESRAFRGRIGRDILASGHMAIYRSAFQEIGGFDERLGPGTSFPGAEDNDLGFRLLGAGYTILYVPDSVVYHRAWKSNREYVPLFWNYGRGQGAFYAKHLRPGDGYMLYRFGKDISRYVSLLPGRLWRRQRTVLLGSTAFLFGILSGSLEWWMTERRAPA